MMGRKNKRDNVTRRESLFTINHLVTLLFETINDQQCAREFSRLLIEIECKLKAHSQRCCHQQSVR